MIAMAADLAREQTLFTAYGVILILLIVAVCWLAHRPSSPRTSPAAEPENSSPARVPATVPAPFVPPGAGNGRHLRLCDELDQVVIRLDDWRTKHGGSAA